MQQAPATIDAYLDGLPDEQRAALQRLREQVRAAAPDATETIAYGIPGFRLEGRYFVGFGASKGFCSFYPGEAPVRELAKELAGYRTRIGTIQFTPSKPLPADLVKKLVMIRLAERRAPS